MQETSIGWTNFSVNLIKYRDADGKVVWACVHASEGCRFCYSQALAIRWGRGKEFTAANMDLLTPFFDEKEAKQVLNSKKIAGKKVFVNDMTDWMGPWVPDEIIDQCVAVFANRSDVTFQTLTKHANRQREYFTDSTLEDRLTDLWQGNDEDRKTWNILLPLQNLHIGVSVEDQKNADKRIPLLLETPAAVRWISAEPLLAPIDLTHVDYSARLRETIGDFAKFVAEKDGEDVAASVEHARASINAPAYLQTLTGQWFDGWDRGNDGKRLDGVVIGGESGAGHREMPLESAVTLAREAKEAGVAVYFKQDSGPRPGMQGRVPDDIWAMKDWPDQRRNT